MVAQRGAPAGRDRVRVRAGRPGTGYASEATTALLDVVFERLDLHRVYASTDARNEASAALLRRLGLRQEAHLREHELFKGEWGDLLVFAVLRSEWDRHRAAARASHRS